MPLLKSGHNLFLDIPLKIFTIKLLIPGAGEPSTLQVTYDFQLTLFSLKNSCLYLNRALFIALFSCKAKYFSGESNMPDSHQSLCQLEFQPYLKYFCSVKVSSFLTDVYSFSQYNYIIFVIIKRMQTANQFQKNYHMCLPYTLTKCAPSGLLL